MSDDAQNIVGPPVLRGEAANLDPSSVADMLEWFLNYDERTARMRHPDVAEIFAWKQSEDDAGDAGFRFDNAESRFAVGIFQALKENGSEELLDAWLDDVVHALHEARTMRTEIEEANKLAGSTDPTLKKAAKLTTAAERRAYLTSCWLDALCTAEARVLGWAYQELYGKPFSPRTS